MSDIPCVVAVEVTTGWTSPDAPREIDSAAIADVPDVPGWLAALDAAGPTARLGLHGRTLTQLVADEPADIIEEAGDWVRVIAPWQPSDLDSRGYPAWIPRSHLAPRPEGDPRFPSDDGLALDRLAICRSAFRHLGLLYLWGGTTPYGLDCSGLIHHSYRRAGLIVPRDAHVQHQVAEPVPLGEEQPGDLYFFANSDGFVFHVGFVTGNNTMLHAPQTGRGIENAPLAPDRKATVFAAGRLQI